MTNVTYEAEFPGESAEDALLDAKAAESVLPFEVDWDEISLNRFWEGGNTLLKDHKDDMLALAEFREREWSWIATLKARGHLN